jgi:tRNA(Ile)-lysidine synthase
MCVTPWRVSGSACAAEALSVRFAAAMDAAGGWEDAPLLALGLSGGADSLCLALLASDWARARGGRALALVIDHGLRPASRTEARLAEAWALRAGLETMVLRLPPGPISAAALRHRRLAALAEAAAGRGALHLLLGHHALDQAETVLLRAMRGSGPRGLAAMASVSPIGPVRLLRPLLGAGPGEIRAWLATCGQPWIADPSNDGRGTRAHLRAAMADRQGEGSAARALAALAAHHGRARQREDAAVAALLGQAASLGEAGEVMLERGAMLAADTPLAAAALGLVLTGLSGRAYPPAPAKLADGVGKLTGEAKFSLGGCVFRPIGSAWRVTRERWRRAAVAETERLGYSGPSRAGKAAAAACCPEGVNTADRP